MLVLPPEQGTPLGQRETGQPRDVAHGREREDAHRAEPAEGVRGGGQEQDQPGVVASGGAGEAEEGAERHTAGEENHRGLGAHLQERNGESKATESLCLFFHSLFDSTVVHQIAG